MIMVDCLKEYRPRSIHVVDEGLDMICNPKRCEIHLECPESEHDLLLTLSPAGVRIEKIDRSGADPFAYFLKTHLIEDHTSKVNIQEMKERWLCDPHLQFCRNMPLKDLKLGLSRVLNTTPKYNTFFEGWQLRGPWFTQDESQTYDNFLKDCLRSSDGATFRAADLYPEALKWKLDPNKLHHKLVEKFGTPTTVSEWPGNERWSGYSVLSEYT